MIHTREEIPSILAQESIGCEIGIFEGEYSQVLVDSKKFKQLYLVDIFSGTASSGDKSGHNVKTYNNASVLYDHNKSKFDGYDSIEIVKEDGIEFLNRMPNLFDFIYIDTVHTYTHTLKELEAAYLSTKKGGYICGHDYNEQQYSGLVRAVKEFCGKYSLSFETTDQDILESYMIQKVVKMSNNSQEFLVTGQAYEKNDPHKQTILLHDTFFAGDETEARVMFSNRFCSTHKIMNIYSAIDVTENEI